MIPHRWSLATVVILVLFLTGCTDVYGPTSASEQWLTYTSAENGFHIKYPSQAWLEEQGGDGCFFGRYSDEGLRVQRLNQSMDSFIKTFGDLSWSTAKVNGQKVKQATSVQRNFTDLFSYQDIKVTKRLFIQNGPSVYVISWSPGWKNKSAPDPATSATYREMIGTFGFNEIIHSDHLDYTDSVHHYSFAYPPAWRVSRGGDMVTVASADYGLRIWVVTDSTAEIFQHRPATQLKDVGEKQPFFQHQLIGQKCLLLGRETYFFEKNKNVYVIALTGRIAHGRELDAILDSFRLPPD